MNNQVKEAYLDREIPYLNANWKYPTMINFWLSIREGFFPKHLGSISQGKSSFANTQFK